MLKVEKCGKIVEKVEMQHIAQIKELLQDLSFVNYAVIKKKNRRKVKSCAGFLF